MTMHDMAILIGQAAPALPLEATWAAVMVIASLGLIIAATCIGPIIRKKLPAEALSYSDDEPVGLHQPDDRGLEIRAFRKRRRR
jgi:hypothetical protein